MARQRATGSTTETESKYDAPAGADFALPSLDDLPQVAGSSRAATEELAAEYFDTPDLVLIRSGITLRRRRGGHDAGWHLKLPVGPQTRREIRRPLGGPARAIPAELENLVRARTRGTELVLVARLITSRQRIILTGSGGEALAEVAIDDVSAEVLGDPAAASSWREVEVELIGGDSGLLQAADKVLRRGGLQPAARSAKLERALGLESEPQPGNPPPPAAAPALAAAAPAHVIGAYLAAQLEVLLAADPRVRTDEPDAVHQMRVTTRRLRSTLQSFGSLLEPQAAALGDELKWLGDLLGAARDAEVLSGHLRASLRELPVEQVIGPVHARIQGHFASVSGQAAAAVQQGLDSERYFALLDGLEQLADTGKMDAGTTDAGTTGAAEADARATGARTTGAGTTGAAEADAVLRKAVRRSFGQVSRRMRRASEAQPGPDRDAALHQARKAAKRARYAAEAVAPVFGRDARRFAHEMKRVQSVLGAHQDTVMARQATRQLGISAHLSGENAFSYGLIFQRDACQAEWLQARAGKIWRHASRPRYRHWM